MESSVKSILIGRKCGGKREQYYHIHLIVTLSYSYCILLMVLFREDLTNITFTSYHNGSIVDPQAISLFITNDWVSTSTSVAIALYVAADLPVVA